MKGLRLYSQKPSIFHVNKLPTQGPQLPEYGFCWSFRMFLTNANMEKEEEGMFLMNRGVPLCQLWKWFRLHFQSFVLLVIISVFLSKTLTLVVTVVTSTCCDQCLMLSHTYLTSCLLLHLYIWHKSITTCKFISAYIHLTWAMLDMSLLRQNISCQNATFSSLRCLLLWRQTYVTSASLTFEDGFVLKYNFHVLMQRCILKLM